MSDSDTVENKFTQRLNKNSNKKKKKKERLISGQGPVAQIMIYVLQTIVDCLKYLYNNFVDILTDCFSWVQEQFFSDFKGFLAGKLKENNGIHFEYTFFRYFITLMLPPMGVFLSRGISAWFNILICGLLCFIKYFPGLIYALIIMQNAPHSERYKKMKRDKLAKKHPPKNKDNLEISYTPVLVFIGAVLISGFAVYMSVKSNPFQKVIGDPLEMAKNMYNNYSQNYSVKNTMQKEVRDKIKGDIKNKIMTQLK
jgi:uncharacterized membrane protein YqaE (UPF0057 family)